MAVEAKKPKKSLFGGLFGSSKGIEVPSVPLAGNISADVGAKVDAAEVPSVEVMKQKKDLFGYMFGSSKGKIEVPSMPLAGDISADVGAKVDAADAAEVPSVEVTKPKKGLFGGLFGSSRAKIEGTDNFLSLTPES